jgi:hypothetical protein
MSILAKKVRLTTLRDLEAFQVDAFDTHKVVAVDTFDTQKIESTNIKVFPSREATD